MQYYILPLDMQGIIANGILVYAYIERKVDIIENIPLGLLIRIETIKSKGFIINAKDNTLLILLYSVIALVLL